MVQYNQQGQPGTMRRLLEVFLSAIKLGLTSFGGPVAHLGYFHNEYVQRRKWLDDRSYADLVALCQFLPGPASSQVGIGIGVLRSGVIGGIVAWIGFTLPSLLLLVIFAFLFQGFSIGHAGWIHGLKLVAVAVVAHAVLGMGRNLAPDRTRMTIAIIVSAVTLLWPAAYGQLILIIAAAAAGLILFRHQPAATAAHLPIPVSPMTAWTCLVLFAGLLAGLPLWRQFSDAEWLAMFDSFYRSGSLVFGGGHVVLPLLEREVIPAGWADAEGFLAGYSVAQAVPGPLFTFAGYLGAIAAGWAGAIIATSAIFLPAFLLVIGTLPFWSHIRTSARMQSALTGVNAAVVGILLAALYHPIWTSTVTSPLDFAFASTLFIALMFWKIPPWIIVLAGALGGTMIY